MLLSEIKYDKKHETTTSSQMSEVAYSSPSGYLRVTFRTTGAQYVYYNVPAQVYDALVAAASHGSYFNTHIKGKYTSSRLA